MKAFSDQFCVGRATAGGVRTVTETRERDLKRPFGATAADATTMLETTKRNLKRRRRITAARGRTCACENRSKFILPCQETHATRNLYRKH